MLFNKTRYVSAALRERRERRELKVETTRSENAGAPDPVAVESDREKEGSRDAAVGIDVADWEADVAVAADRDCEFRLEGSEEAEVGEESASMPLCRSVAAALLVSSLPVSGTSAEPSGPQITNKIGNSFAQLLTSSAVLIALGLAGDGGGRG